MSRTYSHKPLSLEQNDNGFIESWKIEYSKRSNIKNSFLARYDRRRIRHTKIDEDDNYLNQSLMEYKRDINARNRYW